MIENLSQLTQQAIAEFKKALAQPMDPNALKKAGVTQATGLVAYDLQAPAKNLFPVLTPIRNRTPRVSGGGGTSTNWKAVIGINTAGLRGFVPEGERNGVITTQVVDKSAPYRTLGLEDSITFEAERAAVGFEDIRATQAQRLLWATMIEEELADLGGNYSVALGTPDAPTVTTDSTGGSIPAGTYNVIVVALTLYGYLASSVTGGVVGQVSVTPAGGGSAFTYGGGSSNKSSPTSTGVLTGSTNVIKASVPVVPGAVAYAWYVGTSGNELLQAITTINSVVLTSLQTSGRQNASEITADNSRNLLSYDGILYQAWASGSGAYIKNMPTGTPGSGTPLTASGDGGIEEINEMFRWMWDNYRISPTRIYVNAQEADNITKKVLTASAAQIPYVTGSEFTAGMRVKSLLNRFAMGVAPEVPLEIHPNMPPGTLLAVTEQLPYPLNGVPNVMEMRLRQDYYQIEWPQRTRKYESGVYFDGVFAHYFPPSIGIITNIGNG
ncbi:hypothetical protein SE15_11180 [Thermanaerothrix daxensis]|uniref:Uncharacterized protein n=1 Tax=Thermanaerothrix daxensis TaxID=869279 RepID=A0A0P6YC22_9CHLR|nr:hypothetical protein [Thermanaerothrix daxensis]KPL82653.1 hypothetical protein SE15_11180 [Thermanaerothrix daxensis]